MNFVCPLPPIKVYVRAEFLYDHQRGLNEYVEGIWCSVKSIKGEAFRFETYLPQYGALYDKLPISAFVWHTADGLDANLPLDVLQIWDALSYHVTVVEKPLLKGLRAQFFAKDRETYQGEYMFTLDTCNPDPRIPDFGFSESIDEHKSYNVLKLNNGQFALQPNNRCQFFDPAFNPQEMRQPDFKVATQKYRVEKHAKWRLGDTNNFNYESNT
jgi:hypothetical protein